MAVTQTYEIRFRGAAVPAVVDAFDGFDVTTCGDCTTLRAELSDQAALYGALERLYALHLELVAVRLLD